MVLRYVTRYLPTLIALIFWMKGSLGVKVIGIVPLVSLGLISTLLFVRWGAGRTVAVLAGAWFLTLAHRLHAGVLRGDPVKPLKLFLHSNNYLAAVFCALAVDSVIPLPLLFG